MSSAIYEDIFSLFCICNSDLKGGAAQLPSPVPAPRRPALTRPRLAAITTKCPVTLEAIITSAQSSLNFLHLCFPEVLSNLLGIDVYKCIFRKIFCILCQGDVSDIVQHFRIVPNWAVITPNVSFPNQSSQLNVLFLHRSQIFWKEGRGALLIIITAFSLK